MTEYIQPNIVANTQQSISVGPTPPAPGYNALWLSTALADARFPSHPGQTLFTFDTGSAMQEPNLWVYGNQVFMLISGQYLFVANDPRGPWVSKGLVLSNAYHAGMWIENGILYLYYWGGAGDSNLHCAYNSLANLAGTSPSAGWTASVILPNANGLPANVVANGWGNTAMIKYNGQYRLFVEYLESVNQHYQTVLMVANSPLGPFSMASGILESANAQLLLRNTPSAQLVITSNTPTVGVFNNDGFSFAFSIGSLIQENGQLVGIFHGSEVSYGGGAGSDIYRGFSQDGGLTWTVDNCGYPVYCRKHHQYELDQVADPCVVWINGVWWCFWSCCNNNNNKFYIRGAPLAPTMKIWDGYGWAPVDQIGGGPVTSGNRGFFERNRYGTGSGAPVFAYDDLPVDPTTSANFPVPLPSASVGCEVRISNITTSTGTVLPFAKGTDVISGANAAITKGQMVLYKSLQTGIWCRMG